MTAGTVASVEGEISKFLKRAERKRKVSGTAPVPVGLVSAVYRNRLSMSDDAT
jgi:hypothetical protein